MKNEERKVNKAEENGAKLTDEQLAQVTGGKEEVSSATETEFTVYLRPNK